MLKNGKRSASKPILGEDASPENKPAEVLAAVKISSWSARKEKLLARKKTKPQESKDTLTNGSLRGHQEYVVHKDELNKKYTDLKSKLLCSNQNINMISNIYLEEIDKYLETQSQNTTAAASKATVPEGTKDPQNDTQDGAKKGG